MIMRTSRANLIAAPLIIGVLMCGKVSAAMLEDESKKIEIKEQSGKSRAAVFVICGTSGAGKTTMCSEIMWCLNEKDITQNDIVLCPVDELTDGLIDKCDQMRIRDKKQYGKLRYITRENFALALRINKRVLEGKSVLVDTVFGSDGHINQEHAEFLSILEGIPVCTIMLHCAPDTLVERTNNRPEHDRKPWNALLQYSNNFATSPTPLLQRPSPLFFDSNSDVISPIQGFVTSPNISRKQVDNALEKTGLKNGSDQKNRLTSYFKHFVPIKPEEGEVDGDGQMFVRPLIEPDLFISNDAQLDEVDIELIVNLIEKRIGKAGGFSIGTSPSSRNQ